MTGFGLCQCGCGRSTTVSPRNDRSRGYVKGQPRRYVSGHQFRRAGLYWLVDPETGCWVWQRHRMPLGYGQLRRDGRLQYAHRWVYEQIIGPIPEGLHIDHLCRNPSCVNPSHLEPVTHKVNCQRGDHYRPRLTHCKRGHEFTPENTLTYDDGRRSCRACRNLTQRIRRRALAGLADEAIREARTSR